jgi:hypothetical protein
MQTPTNEHFETSTLTMAIERDGEGQSVLRRPNRGRSNTLPSSSAAALLVPFSSGIHEGGSSLTPFPYPPSTPGAESTATFSSIGSPTSPEPQQRVLRPRPHRRTHSSHRSISEYQPSSPSIRERYSSLLPAGGPELSRIRARTASAASNSSTVGSATEGLGERSSPGPSASVTGEMRGGAVRGTRPRTASTPSGQGYAHMLPPLGSSLDSRACENASTGISGGMFYSLFIIDLPATYEVLILDQQHLNPLRK